VFGGSHVHFEKLRFFGGAPLAVPVLKLGPTQVSSACPVGLEAWYELQHWHSQWRPAPRP
jgi:hypothetical protein